MVHTDVETFSNLSVLDVGSFRYAEDISTELLLLSWAFGDGPVGTWRVDQDLPLCPQDLVERIVGGEIFAAHNAQFEHAVWHNVCHKRLGWPGIPLRQWYCVAAQTAALALPRALERAGAAMHLDTAARKDLRGAKLIRLFCMPRKPSKNNPTTRVHPKDAPVEWEEFVAYNQQDVVSERALHKRLPKLRAREMDVWRFDTKINERGLPLDIPLIRKAVNVSRVLERDNALRAMQITEGISPTRNAKIMQWLADEGVELANLQRKPLEEYLEANGEYLPDHVRELLGLRMESARVSVKKLLTMLLVASADGRARGTLLFWGARTGRWAGKLLQPHNYVRGTFTQYARDLILEALGQEDIAVIRDLAEVLEGAGALEALSNVLRGFIAAHAGRMLYVVDYKNIESRIVVWLAGQDDVVEMYHDGVDLYRWMGGHVYGKKPHEITSEERRVAKHIVLGCGFGMGPPKFVRTCKEQGGFDVSLSFAKIAVKMYRDLHPRVKRLWYDTNDAAVNAVRHPGKRFISGQGRLEFYCEDSFLFMQLPSGRRQAYPYPTLEPDPEYGNDAVTYMSENSKTHQWERERTYGGKLVENGVQAIACDVMVEGMVNAERAAYEVDFTAHDEIIAERDEGTGDLHEFEQLVCRLPAWADKCPITADAYTAKRWRKQ
jgi:DNA polymerase